MRNLLVPHFRLRVIYLIRDPVERLFSMCKHHARASWSPGYGRDPLALYDEALLEEALAGGYRSDYGSTLAAIDAAFEPADVLIGFYETLFQESSIRQITNFLGVRFHRSRFRQAAQCRPFCPEADAGSPSQGPSTLGQRLCDPGIAFSRSVSCCCEGMRSPARMKAHFINLDSAETRREALRLHLTAGGFEPVRFAASTPVDLPPILNDLPCAQRAQAAGVPHQSPPPAATIAAEPGDPDEAVLILEDDCLLRPGLRLDRVLSKAPPDWQILQLGLNNPAHTERLLNLQLKHRILWVRWEPHFWGAFAYLVRRSAARLLADRFLPGGAALDLRGTCRPDRSVADFLLYDNVLTYTKCWPCAAFRTDFASGIDAEGYDPDIFSRAGH